MILKQGRSMAVVMLIVVIAALSGVLPAARTASAAPSLTVARVDLAPNDAVAVSGNGFTPGDVAVVSTVFSVNRSSQNVAVAVYVNGNGGFNATYSIPRGVAAGTYILTARDFHGHLASRTINILPLVYVKAGNNYGATTVVANHSFYVRADSFAPNEAVTLSVPFPTYGGNTVVVTRSVRVDHNGHLGLTLIAIPRDARQGTTTLTITGNSSGRVGRTQVRVVYQPSLKLAASTIRPGTTVAATGHDFVPFAHVRVSITIPRTANSQITLSHDVSADGRGDFHTSVSLPSDVRIGTYTITATDLRSGVRAFARITASVHPEIAVQPRTAEPGQQLAVTGGGFGTGTRLVVSGVFSTTSGARTVSSAVYTVGNGSFSAFLTIPSNATTQSVVITARSNNGSAQVRVQVMVPPTPTAIPPTATPAPTSTPVPAPKHHHKFRFQYVSLWYHPVVQGQFDHLVVQGRPHRFLGIWVKINYPSGRQTAFYETTDARGHWEKDFQIRRDALSAGSGKQATITFQLWKGSQSRKNFLQFYIKY